MATGSRWKARSLTASLAGDLSTITWISLSQGSVNRLLARVWWTSEEKLPLPTPVAEADERLKRFILKRAVYSKRGAILARLGDNRSYAAKSVEIKSQGGR